MPAGAIATEMFGGGGHGPDSTPTKAALSEIGSGLAKLCWTSSISRLNHRHKLTQPDVGAKLAANQLALPRRNMQSFSTPRWQHRITIQLENIPFVTAVK